MQLLSEHREGKFLGAGATNLYYQSWHPNGEIRAIILIVHGLGAHSGIFDNLVEFLIAHHYAVYGLDLRGHGRSPGQRGYINNWSEFREDLRAFRQLIAAQESELPLFLLGQSLGGTITLDYILHYPGEFQGLIAIAPALEVNISPVKLIIGRILAKFLPRFTLNTGIDLAAGSRDPRVVAAYAQDPLRHSQGTARLATEFLRTAAWIKREAAMLQVPLLILHGGADRVTLLESSRLLFETITFADKEKREYPESYHELHNDLNYQEVLTDIEDWLEKHLNLVL
jgi:alpha-beta hydrolase superfamily lysophospholipase